MNQGSFWGRVVKLCKDLQAVIAIAALVLAVLPYLWSFLLTFINPEYEFGNLSEVVFSREHIAEDDGFVVAVLGAKDKGTVALKGYVNNERIAEDSVDKGISGADVCSISFTVKKGEKWNVDVSPKNANYNGHVHWRPLQKK